MVKRLECTQTYTGIQWVHEADYDALAARYDHAVELLGLWLDGVCPSQDTEAFLRPADSADAYVGKPVPLAEVLQRTNAVYEAAAAADSASPTNPTEVSSGLVPADQPEAGTTDYTRGFRDGFNTAKNHPAQPSAVQTDAERYRWLRERHIVNDWGDGSLSFHWRAPLDGGGSLDRTLAMYRDSLDAAIDAARTTDQQSAREGLDELTRMAQEDGLYDMPTDKT
jgi:hypothetical protein